MLKKKSRNEVRLKRHIRIRKSVFGMSQKPRLCVFVSNKFIYTQIIDDVIGHTMVFASTKEEIFANSLINKKNTNAAIALGTELAKRALENNIQEVVFDRGGYLYHGKISALADAVRKAGLKL